MELRTRRTGNAVRRPGVDVVRLLGEVRTGVDVPVAAADNVRVVAAVRADVLGDCTRDRGAAVDSEAPALAEVVLYVDHNKCAAHAPSSYLVAIAGSPGDKSRADDGSSASANR